MLRINIEGNVNLPKEARPLLEILFKACSRVIVKQEFSGNFSGSLVFLVQPIKDGYAQLPAVVKLAPTGLIRRELDAFDAVQSMLYDVLQIQGHALLPDHPWGALRYPLQGGGAFDFETLVECCRHRDVDHVRLTFERLFDLLELIYNQNRTLPEVPWRRSYDRVLPPNHLIEAASPPHHADIRIVSMESATREKCKPGQWVRLEDVCVTKVDLRKQTVTLDVPNGAPNYYTRLIAVANPEAYEVGQIVTCIEGRIVETRTSLLRNQIAQAVGVQVDWAAPNLRTPEGIVLPNPLSEIDHILNHYRSIKASLIHGDLNLNNILVDVETAHPGIIDVTEAREDHVLHDVFRLETEVVTKLIPEILRERGLSPSRTLYQLYHHLHCATFEEDRIVTAPLPHPDLETCFEVLKIIRKKAQHYLYKQDDATEYYQGLFLYLMGALKFANLDRAVTAPLPKQAAFWSAATIQEILTSGVPCEQVASLDLAPSPDALLLDYRPMVKVMRREQGQLVDAVYGLPLFQGDTISTYVNAEACVHCRQGAFLTIPEQRNQPIDCTAISDQQRQVDLAYKYQNQLTHIVRAFTENLAQPEPGAEPRLISPRNTAIIDKQPVFQWHPVPDAESYRLVIRMDRGQRWQQKTRATSLAYPSRAPRLKAGHSYTVIIEVVNTPHPRDYTRLRILDQDSAAQVKAVEQEIEQLELSSPAAAYAHAHLYQRWGLLTQAIQMLEASIHTTEVETAMMALQLGTLYLQVGLWSQAAAWYQSIIALPQTIATIKEIAHIGLASVDMAQRQPQSALEHLDQVMGHALKSIAAYLQEEVKRHSKKPDISILSVTDYVRRLAERIAPHLIPEIRKIPDVVFKRLDNVQASMLKPNWSPATLGRDDVSAIEILAATYITTATLSKQQGTFQADITLIQAHAEDVAQHTIGLERQAARDFALRYVENVKRELDMLKDLT